MAARKRLPNESFKAYRSNLIEEEKITQLRLRGRWAHRTSTRLAGIKFRGTQTLPRFQPYMRPSPKAKSFAIRRT